MFDVIKPLTDVLVREKNANEPFKVGQIIVAKKNGIKFIHRIEKILLVNNKQYFVTKGTNNQYFDNGFITEDDIVGIADLSEEAFTRVQEIIEEKRIERGFAIGMTNNFKRLIDSDLINQFEGYIDSCYSIEKMKEEFQNIEDNDQHKELLGYFEAKYRRSYKEVLYFKLRTKYFSSSYLQNILAQAKDFKVLDPVTLNKIPGDIDPFKIYGMVESEKIVNVKDLSEASELKSICWLKLGNHEYTDPRGQGQGISHIIARHLNDFKKYFGLTDPMQIAEFILDIISKNTGVREESGWVFFKTGFINNKDGKPLYLRIGFDEFGSINTAYPTRYNYMRNKIINLNPNAAQYLL